MAPTQQTPPNKASQPESQQRDRFELDRRADPEARLRGSSVVATKTVVTPRAEGAVSDTAKPVWDASWLAKNIGYVLKTAGVPASLVKRARWWDRPR